MVSTPLEASSQTWSQLAGACLPSIMWTVPITQHQTKKRHEWGSILVANSFAQAWW